MQHSPDKGQSNNGTMRRDNSAVTNQQAVPVTQSMELQSDLQMSLFQQQSALETLAEVSRRHLDFHQNGNGHEQIVQNDGRSLAEQLMLAQLQQNDGFQMATTAGADSGSLSFYSPDVPSPEDKFDSAQLASSALAAPPSLQTAPEMSRQRDDFRIEADGPQQLQSEAVDPQLNSLGTQLEAQLQYRLAHDRSEDHRMVWHTDNPASQSFGSLTAPPTDPTSVFGLPQKLSRSKARSRFTDNRRKEVQEIRKRGACMRCRMLKKPCSDGDPCNTCRSVETARLWKGTCLRTRLADEFTLWSVGFHHARARQEVPAAVLGLEQRALPGRIEVRLFQHSNSCMTFACKQYGDQHVDPTLLPVSDDGSATRIWLLDEGEVIPDRLEEYIKHIAATCVEREESQFVKATLRTAQTLLRAEQAEARVPEEQTNGRSCYNLQTQLLKNVIELWVETCILSAPDNYQLQLQYDDAKEPQQQPEGVRWAAGPDTPSLHGLSSSSNSHLLIKMQLLAATESRAARLSKQIINELERRLLQRQQVSRFSTYISAVILLSCVERMTGFFRQLHMGTDDPSQPLSDSSSGLWTQGEHFADLVNTLLRMRALPPKTMPNADGTLSAFQEFVLPVHVQGKAVKEDISEQMKDAANWLDPIKLNINELVAKRDGVAPATDEGLEAWEMKFLAKVLLPERLK